MDLKDPLNTAGKDPKMINRTTPQDKLALGAGIFLTAAFTGFLIFKSPRQAERKLIAKPRK